MQNGGTEVRIIIWTSEIYARTSQPVSPGGTAGLSVIALQSPADRAFQSNA